MSETELSPIKRALIEQRRLKARIEELERARSEPIAVIGVGCRFPGASGPEAFWELLRKGVDAISDMPSDRWDVEDKYDPDPEAPGKFATRFGGYLENIDQFDAHLFGISPREAATMDPQQRVLLEVTWEAFQHAGLAADSLAGSATGVFVGIGPNDYFQLYVLRGEATEIDAYLATGNAHSVASGRISYLLGLHGPSISVDTACSSSLVAVHLACESIRSGSCTTAVAGGVGILLGEQNYISLSKARMMALNGRCKTFDAGADGFVRSEGCGMVVLKRLSDAQRDGDRVLAVIRGSAVNQDGRSNGITAPNGPAQQAVIRAAHANAGTSPPAVSYVEAHGTGTVLGDPIEVESLAAVLGAGRSDGQPLLVGSVKTNIGHTEAAAGVAGLIKTVLALHHREIPPSLHFRTPNPLIAWDEFPYLRVATSVTPWAAQDGRRIAGVSAFGFGGTNAHVVLEEAPAAEGERSTIERPLQVLALSAKTDAALRITSANVATRFGANSDTLADICYSVNTARAALPHRALVVARGAEEMRSRVQHFADRRTDAKAHSGVTVEGTAPRVMFVFSNDDSEDVGLTRSLYDTQPAFHAALSECDALLVATGQPGVVNRLGTVGSKLERFAVRYSLSEMWKSWGVTPDAVFGDGVGNYVAAVVAGTLRLDAALRFASGYTSDADAPELAPVQVPFFSSAVGRRATRDDFLGIARWAEPAALESKAAALAAAARDGFGTIVEVGTTSWDALIETLGDLYVRGVAIDWRGFDRGYARSRVDVPLSPWMRERHWFAERPASNRASVESPAPSKVVATPEPAAAAGAVPAPTLRDRLSALTHGERQDIVQQLVQSRVMRVLRLRPDASPPGMSDRLMSIGMDSLMAVELQKHLHKDLEDSVRLPSTLIFDHPTIASIGDLVLRLLGFDNVVVADARVEVVVPKSTVAAEAIADLTDDEIEALLTEQLKDFPG
ncbi:MAG: beta-ketoacyl synthase N-terminal-like domain-containing protein [bacterium]